MSEKKRNTATQVYQDAVLSSFSEREMEFARRVSNSSVEIINPSILSEFKFAKPSYDSNGNIVDFTVSGLPGVDANGKPTKQTTDWLLSELDNSRFDSRAAFIKLPGGRGTISIGEASAIVRSRHGIDFLQSVGPKGKTNYYEFGTVSSPTSFSKMQSYIKEHTIARELLTTINNSVEERERLINNGDMILSQEERFVPGPSGNKVSVGPSETYVYRPGLPNAGKTFDFNTPVQNILSKYGITPGTKEATSVGKEMDQLASGLKTRNEADGTRLDRNGNVQGGPTSEMAKILVPAVDENGKQKKDSSGNIIYEVSKGVGVVKKTAASVTLGGILTHELGSALASAPSEIRLFAKFLGNAEHWIVGHGKYGEGALPMGNKLIYLKMLYGAIKVYKGEGDAYNNPVTPFALHAFIHFLSGQLTKTGVRVPLRLSGWGNFLEVVWISSEFTWEFAIKPTLEEYRKSRERNETDAKLWQEALSIGCYPPRYVESGGSACIRCQTTVIWDPISKKKIPVVDYGPSVTLNSNIVLPIGVERDKDGNIIYVDDPLDRNPIKRKIPKYIYPQPKPVPPVNENGTSRGLPNQSTTRNGRSVFTPFNFRIGRDATSVEKYCFSGETLISTPNGKLEIRDLNIGDSVLSFDSNLNVTSDVISNVFKHSDSNIYEYKLSNGVILNATENHPVLVNGVEFKEISKVNDDEFLIDESNEKVFIVDKKYLRKDFSYNIEVKNNNTYMANGIFVHNKSVVEFEIADEIFDEGDGTSTYISVIPSHSTTEEAEHNFYINSTYKDSLDANATKNLMIVRANANSSEDSSLNAGPIYGATDVSVEPNSNVTRELDAIREKDRILSQKDAAWLKQMYESGIITNEGTGAKGGGTLPPGAGIDTPPTQNSEGVPNTPFTIDLGPIIIYFSGTWANIVTKSDKPSKQYGPDGITACFPSWSRVMVPNGETEISNLKNGDEVYTYSIDGNLEKSKIISTERHEEKNYTVKRYQLNNGKVLDVTDNHVVLTSSGVYKKLSDLSENDYLVYFDGSSVRIESVELLGEYPVYNIKVDKNESYIVNGIVVHDR